MTRPSMVLEEVEQTQDGRWTPVRSWGVDELGAPHHKGSATSERAPVLPPASPVPPPSSPSSLRAQLASIFLPLGYPASVRAGYMEYQLWDLVQGLTSYLRSNLAIKELLAGLGVGDVAATASAGALGWIMLNGASMLGGLLFTWRHAAEFGNDIRQWRLFADVINDIGLTLNMLAPLFGKEYFLYIAAAGSVCTAMCGVAAGATKPAISQVRVAQHMVWHAVVHTPPNLTLFVPYPSICNTPNTPLHAQHPHPSTPTHYPDPSSLPGATTLPTSAPRRGRRRQR